MKWSKLKAAFEGFLADLVRGRFQFYMTQYGPRGGTAMSRAWITWEGQEIANFSTVEWMREHDALASQIREINHCQDYRDASQREGYYAAYQEAVSILDQRGVYTCYDLKWALMGYLNLTVEDALTSDNTLIRALAMFDRRLGKRRLRRMQLAETEHALVRQFYALRCEAEGIAILV